MILPYPSLRRGADGPHSKLPLVIVGVDMATADLPAVSSRLVEVEEVIGLLLVAGHNGTATANGNLALGAVNSHLRVRHRHVSHTLVAGDATSGTSGANRTNVTLRATRTL